MSKHAPPEVQSADPLVSELCPFHDLGRDFAPCTCEMREVDFDVDAALANDLDLFESEERLNELNSGIDGHPPAHQCDDTGEWRDRP